MLNIPRTLLVGLVPSLVEETLHHNQNAYAAAAARQPFLLKPNPTPLTSPLDVTSIDLTRDLRSGGGFLSLLPRHSHSHRRTNTLSRHPFNRYQPKRKRRKSKAKSDIQTHSKDIYQHLSSSVGRRKQDTEEDQYPNNRISFLSVTSFQIPPAAIEY